MARRGRQTYVASPDFMPFILPWVMNGGFYLQFNSPPYKLSCSSFNMSMISHSKTLLPTSPQLIPGMSLSVCICLNCLPKRIAALELLPGELEAARIGAAMDSKRVDIGAIGYVEPFTILLQTRQLREAVCLKEGC